MSRLSTSLWTVGYGEIEDQSPPAKPVKCHSVAKRRNLFAAANRRLRLQLGQVAPIRVLFIHVPTLEIEPWDQRYTGIGPGLVRYESVASGFQRDLTVDEDGLVVDYPGLFTRVWASSD